MTVRGVFARGTRPDWQGKKRRGTRGDDVGRPGSSAAGGDAAGTRLLGVEVVVLPSTNTTDRPRHGMCRPLSHPEQISSRHAREKVMMLFRAITYTKRADHTFAQEGTRKSMNE